jgi:hypothetical protein
MSLPKPIAPHFNDNGNSENEHGSSESVERELMHFAKKYLN